MGFSDYPMPTTLRKSYIGSQKVLNYLEAYANHFNVVECIKFRHNVIRVRPVQDTKWEVCEYTKCCGKIPDFVVNSKRKLNFLDNCQGFVARQG